MSRTRAIARGRTRRSGRRGYSRQRSSRRADRTVWRSALTSVRWLGRRGQGEREAVRRIGLRPRTVRSWVERWHEDRLAPRPRGRPVDRADRELRNAILSLFDLVGPEITEQQLGELFPEVARAELRELKRRYRAVWRKKGSTWISALRWSVPGSVWAMDFTTPPRPVDGIFGKILLVRDLASARQLATLPAGTEDGATVRGQARALIRQHGPPLVAKVDNGPGFRARETTDLLEEHGVLPLFSPPYTPSYNGAVETGNGTLKVHAHYASVRNDRPGEWTADDVEAGRLRGNALGRPHGHDGPTPDQAWQNRKEITEAERIHFREVYEEEYEKRLEELGVPPLFGPTPEEKNSIDRHAISRALIRCGYLWIRRRRITPPISTRKRAGIS